MARTQDFTNVIGKLGDPTSVKLWSDLVDDLASIKAKIAGINAKLDADAGVSGTDFAALWNVGVLKTKK